MRVTGGDFSGRNLELPKGPQIRPTRDQVRQALFNLLGDRLAGVHFLDLFSGSGSVGIEALSRGASHVTFVDRSKFSIQAIRTNLGRLSLAAGNPKEAPATLIRADAASAIRKLSVQGASFPLIFLDPPYGGKLARISLIALGRYAILASSGLVVAEHDKRDILPKEVGTQASRLVLQRQQRYGDTALTIYSRQ